jgi:TolB-like protein/tetratricopeptide (TPR) repeat protein
MQENPPPAAKHAVFISYGREDTAAAQRLTEALRSQGVEVWFDHNELRGGDVWDQKIRRQIKECALFVPVISANTQDRSEGYFRLEWKLAVERTHLMLEGVPFLAPVVIDETPESGAAVPSEFMKVQWMRLPGALPTPQFVEQVRLLLESPHKAAPSARAASAIPAAPSSRPSGIPAWLAAVVGVASLCAVIYVASRPAAKAPAGPAKPASDTSAEGPPSAGANGPSVAPLVDEKSIAVLPFVNMSTDADQGFFADGLAEELLNLLAKVPTLQVTSRSSAFSYKGKDIKLDQVARELGVAHILEGSVRRSGNRLRITAQLIDARTDKHLWSETYDRMLDDIFAVQDEIAAAVVSQLKVTILGAAPKAKAADPKAYALFLEGQQLIRQNTEEGLKGAVMMLKQALATDPNLAAAWAALASCYLLQSSSGALSDDEAVRLAREAVNKALSIDSSLARAQATLGSIELNWDNDLPAAAGHFEHALALEPANTDIMSDEMLLLRSLGRLEQSVLVGEYITAHDPVNPFGHARLGAAYIRVGRIDDGIASIRTSLRLSPGRFQAHYTLGLALLQKGELQAALAEMQQEPGESWRLDGSAMIYHALGQKAQSDAALAELIGKYERDASWNIGYVMAFRGEVDRSFEWLDKAIANRDPGLSDTAVTSAFTNLHHDPRWLPFLRKIGRAPEQLAAIKYDLKLPSK